MIVAESRGKFGGGAGRDPGFGMDTDDQEFLNQIEQNIRGKDNEQDVARKEAEQRAAEMERIRKASANIKIPGTGPRANAPTTAATSTVKNPLEDDPRYREYFERLRRQKGETVASASSPSNSTQSASAHQTPTAKNDSRSVGPGAIVQFDDGSIGVYKDAVSGRDYALFYFLQPDGEFSPEGVFLQCYQAKVIGNMPENYFAELRVKETWNRDVIVFHLSAFEHTKFLDSLAEHEDRKPKNTTPSRNIAVQGTPQTVTPAPMESLVQAPPAISAQEKPAAEPQQAVSEPTPTSNQGLVKGRKFQIKFGGKQWEAVYWISDEQGAIVAHATHGNWSLMRLDLERFKDSLELQDIIDAETMTAIAQSAAVPK